jgi:Calcineurin-like phosphoesterase
MLTFLQLSDIHFRGKTTVGDDGVALDYGFREQLLADAQVAGEQAGGISGVMICGDIAQSGFTSEFGQASEWLANLCAAIGVDPWLVWVVPGNHDLEQKRIGESQWREREALRSCAAQSLDALLEEIVEDPARREMLTEPLYNYLEFASGYDCMFGPEPFWTDLLELDSERLELRGINSALICGPGDHARERPMVIGRNQASVTTAPGTVHYTLCHHPGEWLLDPPETGRLFDERVHIRVTGHVHIRGVETTALGIYLRAGAVAPRPGPEGVFIDPCIPRYDLVSLRTREVDSARHLEIIIRGRRWSEAEGWQPDRDPLGTVARRYRLGAAAGAVEIEIEPGLHAEALRRPERELRYRLSLLQAYDRNTCAQQIGIPPDTLAAAAAHQQVAEIMAWAKEHNQLPALSSEVFAAAQIPDPPESPFQ